MTTLEELKQLINKTFEIDPETLDSQAPLADFGLDSIATAELLFSVEDHFGLELPTNRLNIKNLEGLAALIDELKQNAQS